LVLVLIYDTQLKTALLYTLLIYIRLIDIIIISKNFFLYSAHCSVMCTLAIADKSSDVAQALLRLAERCFNLLNETRQKFGVQSPSPLTLLRIIHQIQPLVKGGGYVEFEYMEPSNVGEEKSRRVGVDVTKEICVWHCRFSPRSPQNTRLSFVTRIMATITLCSWTKEYKNIRRKHLNLAPVVRKVDNAVQWKNHYPVDSVVCFCQHLSAG